jgi:hypothetical protein
MKFTLTDDYMPSNFRDAIRLVTRPYIPISEKQVKVIESKTKDRGDIILYRGKRMTWGNADGGFALMPLISQ